MNESELSLLATNTMKSIARNEQIKQQIKGSEDLYTLLFRAAKRFIVGESRDEAISIASKLLLEGYSASLEYIGENISDEQRCRDAKDEFLQLTRMAGQSGLQSTISLDLSHIGMTVNAELAYDHLVELAREAALYGITIMISAEEASKKDQILTIYRRISENFSNIGITLQAYLHRTESDLEDIKHLPGRIRLVKGAYQESSENALPRSVQLHEKYIRLTEILVTTGRTVSIATHDEAIIKEVKQRGYLELPNVELEMLYGISPDLLKKIKNDGYRTRVYLPYGREWHLYFFHRLAEYPPNIYQAMADLVTPSIKGNIY